MYTHFRIAISLFFLGLFVSLAKAQTDKMLFDFEGGFDVSDVETNNAEVAITNGNAGQGQALNVVLEKNKVANIQLKSGQSWGDLSGHLGIEMDITNNGEYSIGIIAEANENNGNTAIESFVWVKPGKTETMFMLFYRSQPPELVKKYLTGMRGLPGGYLWHWRIADLTKLNTLIFYTAKTDKDVIFTVDNVRAMGEYRPPTEKELQSNAFWPFVDRFGQLRQKDWPGKTYSVDDITNQHQEELIDLAAHPGPDNRNKYGGWTEGPQLEATGHFRTQKVDGKWWLVDPEGRLFWSQGITGVRLSQTTKTRGRENYFAEILDNGDFRQANLKRKFGENWNAEAAELIHTRLRSWGINTFANWSDEAIYNLRKTPYVVSLRSGIAKQVPPQLDAAAFGNAVQKHINTKTVAGFKDDPWCLGVFVDNELHWPGKNTGPVAETYYKVVKEVFKNVAPNILYLGSRIHGSGGPSPAYIAAANHCDVVSINRYKFAIIHEDLPEGSLDKPMIIGEFHFGALDRGLLHTGLKGVSNQEQRAHAYTYYVHQALENDRIVGAHWFQHTDQMVTGRGDGESYQIGFVDIVDRPYPEMLAASRRLGECLYDYRKTGIVDLQ